MNFPEIPEPGPSELQFHAFPKKAFPSLDINKVCAWLYRVAESENQQIGQIHYTFLSDDALLATNREFLHHDYYTDIITFPYTKQPLEADILISVDRVLENAALLSVTATEECLRVMVHGLLHLCGYQDDTETAQREMRRKETDYIRQFMASNPAILDGE